MLIVPCQHNPEFTVESGIAHADNGCGSGGVISCLDQGVNLLTLVFGKLYVVSHQYLSFPAERKAKMLPHLALCAT
jgi:hypothetical protein